MKRILFPATFVVALIIGILSSCNKNEDKATELNLQSKTTDVFKSFAKLVYDDLKSKGSLTHSMIKEYNKTKIEEFLLCDLNSNLVSERNSSTTQSISNILATNPLMDVAFPSFDPDFETLEQHLANIDYVILLNVNPNEVNQLSAIDKNGNSVLISSVFDETKKYAVIKEEEGSFAVNVNTKITTYGETVPVQLLNITPRRTVGDYRIYDNTDLSNVKSQLNGTGVPTGDGGNDTPISERGSDDCPNADRTPETLRDQFRSVAFTNFECVKAYESGFHLPKVELRVIYLMFNFNTRTNVTQEFTLRGHWKDMTTKEMFVNLYLPIWRYKTFGDFWQCTAIEEDPAPSTISLNLGFDASIKVFGTGGTLKQGVSTTFTIGKGDIRIGTVLMNYCDPAAGLGTQYKYSQIGPNGSFLTRERITP